MPSWASTYKKHVSEGFEIIAIEGQNSSDTDINTMVKAKSAEFETTTGGNLKGAVVTGIPHGFLFGADGNLIAEKGLRGAELEKRVATAVKECGAAMAGPGPYTKLSPLAMQIKSGIGLGSVLKTLTTKKASKDAVEVAEATMMYDALHNSGTEQLEGAIEKKADEPLVSLTKFEHLAVQFSGDDIGKKSTEQVAAMRKDPAVVKEIEGEKLWKLVQDYHEKLKPVRGEKNPKDEVFRKQNAAGILTVIQGCQAVITRYPGTKIADRAKSLMEEFH